MGFGEQTEDRDLPHYIVVGTIHPAGGTGYYVATRASLVRVSPVLYTQAIAVSLAEQYDRQMRATGAGPAPYTVPEPVLNESDWAAAIRSIGNLSTVDPAFEPEEPEYRRVKTPVEDADYFTAAGCNVALGMEAPYPLNLSAKQTEKVASALLTFNLLGFRVRLERIHD